VSSAYSFSKLQTAGNYFTRLVLAAGIVVDAKLTIVLGDPDPHDVELRSRVMAFFPKPRPPRKLQGWMRCHAPWTVAQLGWLQCARSTRSCALIHSCSPKRCACTSREQIVRRFARAFVRSGLAHRSATPSLKEWTLVGQSLRWNCFGICSNKILPLAFSTSCDRLSAGHDVSRALVHGRDGDGNPLPMDWHTAEASRTAPAKSAAEKFFAEMDWQEIQTKRISHVRGSLSSTESHSLYTLLGLVVNAGEHT